MTVSMEDFPNYSAHTLLAMMEQMELPFDLHRHDPVFTVAESVHVSQAIPGMHTRNLFLKDKKERMFLVTLQESRPLDLKKLSGVLDAGRFSFGSAERLWAHLGVRPGAVTPLSILNDKEKQVSLVLDDDMMRAERINVHPLDNSMTVGFSPRVLLAILESHDVKPHIVDLKQAQP